VPDVLGRVHWASECKEDTFPVFGIKSQSIWSTRPKRENLGFGECYAKFESMEFQNLFIEDPRGGGKVKVDMDLPQVHSMRDVSLTAKGKNHFSPCSS